MQSYIFWLKPCSIFWKFIYGTLQPKLGGLTAYIFLSLNFIHISLCPSKLPMLSDIFLLGLVFTAGAFQLRAQPYLLSNAALTTPL